MATQERPEGEPSPDEAEARRARIRRWYAEARRMGISEEDFYKEMTPIVGDEEIERALEDEE